MNNVKIYDFVSSSIVVVHARVENGSELIELFQMMDTLLIIRFLAVLTVIMTNGYFLLKK